MLRKLKILNKQLFNGNVPLKLAASPTLKLSLRYIAVIN